MAAIAQAGGAFDWLTEEPDLYTDVNYSLFFRCKPDDG